MLKPQFILPLAEAEKAPKGEPAATLLDCEIQPRPLSYPLSDYHRAGVDGPLHYTWTDKPHRLLYDLIAAVKFYAALAAQQPAAEAVAEVYRAHYGNNKRDIGFDSVRLLPGAKVEPGMKLYAAAPAVPQVAAQQPAAQSLLRKPVKHISEISAQIPGGCYCPPGTCQAPVIMGRQTPCLRRQDAAPPAPQPETKGGAA